MVRVPLVGLGPVARRDEDGELAQPRGQRALEAQVVAHRARAAHHFRTPEERHEWAGDVGVARGGKFLDRLTLSVGQPIGGNGRHPILCVYRHGGSKQEGDNEDRCPGRGAYAHGDILPKYFSRCHSMGRWRSKTKGDGQPTVASWIRPSVNPADYFRCLLTSLVIANMLTWLLPPNTALSASSALIMRLFFLSCRPFFLM